MGAVMAKLSLVLPYLILAISIVETSSSRPLLPGACFSRTRLCENGPEKLPLLIWKFCLENMKKCKQLRLDETSKLIDLKFDNHGGKRTANKVRYPMKKDEDVALSPSFFRLL